VALRGITADPDDLRAREMALYGCYLAALSFASAGSGMHHKIAHVLGGTFNLPHAQVHATVLPYVLAFNAPAVPEASARLADALGSDSGDATEALNALYREIGAPRALADIGFTEDGISEAVERSLNAIPDSTPTAPTEENLTVLLRAALTGEDPATVFAATEQA
jgi:maleylacetate reductase